MVPASTDQVYVEEVTHVVDDGHEGGVIAFGHLVQLLYVCDDGSV